MTFERLPQDLGVTAVELMPVQEFNETSVWPADSQPGQALKQYWGYARVVFEESMRSAVPIRTLFMDIGGCFSATDGTIVPGSGR